MKKRQLKEEGNLYQEVQEPLNPEEEEKENQTGVDSSFSITSFDKALARDVLKLPFDVWHIIIPEVNPLDDNIAERLSEPFIRIIYKYGLESFFKDELLLIIGLGSQVVPRAYITFKRKKKEKNADNDNRQEGSREDYSGQETNN